MFPESILLRLVYLARYALPTLLLVAVLRRRKPAVRCEIPGRILVVRLDWIGDFLMDTPFLRELRRNYPDARITLVVGRKVEQLAVACPYVDEVIVLEVLPRLPAFSNHLRYIVASVRHLIYLVTVAGSLLARHFDLAIQPRWDADFEGATLITVLSGAPRTVAYSERTSTWKTWCNFGYDRLLTDAIPPGGASHDTDRSLNIVRYLGGSVESSLPEAWWRPEDERVADQFLRRHSVPSSAMCIAFGVGASSARRHWPYYGELICLLAREVEFTPLVLAGPGEEQIAKRITDVCSSAVVMQNLPLGVVAAGLARCALYVGNDSGPMHLASAVRVPVVEISCHPVGGDPAHVNSPDRTGPLALRRSIIRPNAFLGSCEGGCSLDRPHCITTISPEQVASAAIQLLECVKDHR